MICESRKFLWKDASDHKYALLQSARRKRNVFSSLLCKILTPPSRHANSLWKSNLRSKNEKDKFCLFYQRSLLRPSSASDDEKGPYVVLHHHYSILADIKLVIEVKRSTKMKVVLWILRSWDNHIKTKDQKVKERGVQGSLIAAFLRVMRINASLQSLAFHSVLSELWVWVRSHLNFFFRRNVSFKSSNNESIAEHIFRHFQFWLRNFSVSWLQVGHGLFTSLRGCLYIELILWKQTNFFKEVKEHGGANRLRPDSLELNDMHM